MLKKANMNWTANTLKNQIAKGNVSFDIVVQRGHVWKNDKDSLLIHSMIEDYPIPPFYFSKTDTGVYEAMDGQQRSHAIAGFLNDNYALCENFEPVTDENGNEFDFSGHKFSELPEWVQDAIKNYNLTIYYFEGLTDEERDSLFYRLNNGQPLTAVELTRVKAKSLEKFQSMAKHELVNLAVTERGKVRYNHENLCFQIWAVCFNKGVSFETKPFRELIESADVNDGQVSMVNKCMDVILEVYKDCDPKDKLEKKIQKRITTRTHTVALCKAVDVALASKYDMDKFKEWVKRFYSGGKSATNDETYNNSCGGGGLARKDKIETRLTSIVENMKKYCG